MSGNPPGSSRNARTLRHLTRQLAAGASLSLMMLVLMVGLTILILQAPVRTVQIQARTLSAEVEMLDQPLPWDLTGATICEPIADLRAEVSPPCAAGQQLTGTLDGPVDWLPGQQVDLIWRQDSLHVHLRNPGDRWPEGTEFVIGSDRMYRNGAIAFVGYLVVGEEIGPGTTGYAIDGSYAFFERGLVGGWLGWSSDVTRQGDIRRGDRLRIVCEQSAARTCTGREIGSDPQLFLNPASVSVTLDPGSSEEGFHVVAHGNEANSLLEIAYAGVGDPAVLVKPNWIQRAAASSSLLAMSLLFSLIAPLLLPLVDRPGRRGGRAE